MTLFAQSMIEGGSLGGLAAGIANSLGRAVDSGIYWITHAGAQTWVIAIGVIAAVAWFVSRR